MDLHLRVHTEVEGEKSPRKFSTEIEHWAPEALILDSETTIDEKLTFNLLCYRKCELRNGLYVCTEEALVHADDLEVRFGGDAVRLLREFAATAQTQTVRGRHARMRFYSQTEFAKKVMFPMYRKGAVIVGANLCFDLSRLALDCSTAKKCGDVWSLIFKNHNGKPDKILPRLIMTPRNSRSAFLKFTAGHKDYEYGQTTGGRFLDVLNLGFALRNERYSLEAACEEWKVEGKDQHQPSGKITKEEIEHCRQDVKCTHNLINAMKMEFDSLPIGSTPEEMYSPASLSKAFLDSMGVETPRAKFSISNKVHGIAMQSYVGARTECRIRKQKVPVMFVDFISQYPSCCVLLKVWDYMIAEDVTVENATEHVRT